MYKDNKWNENERNSRYCIIFNNNNCKKKSRIIKCGLRLLTQRHRRELSSIYTITLFCIIKFLSAARIDSLSLQNEIILSFRYENNNKNSSKIILTKREVRLNLVKLNCNDFYLKLVKFSKITFFFVHFKKLLI